MKKEEPINVGNILTCLQICLDLSSDASPQDCLRAVAKIAIERDDLLDELNKLKSRLASLKG